MQIDRSALNVPSIAFENNRVLENSTLLVTAFTSFIAPFMISAVNVALPAIQTEFNIDAVLLSWVATSYIIAKLVLLVPIGQIANILGQKKIFTLGLSLFLTASLLSALANTITVLLIFRVLMGLASAMVITTGVAILTAVFPPSRRGRAMGIYVAAVYLGLSIGPTIGGVLTENFGWRSVFLSAMPLGLIALFVTTRYLKKEWKEPPGQKFDLSGSIVYAFSLIAIGYAASFLPEPITFLFAAMGFAGLFIFVVLEKKTSSPVFEVGLFQNNRTFTFSGLAALINYAATYTITLMISLYLQYVKGLSPQTTGFILVFQPVMQVVFSPLAGRLSDRIEPRAIASLGMGITAVGLLLLVFIGPTTSIGYIIGLLSMVGIGFGAFSSPNMNAIMSSVERKHLSSASGAVATMRLFGQMVSMVVVTIVFSILLGDMETNAFDQVRLVLSCRIVFSISTIFCVAEYFFR